MVKINRSTLYYKSINQKQDTELANEIYEIWRKWPFYGYRRITAELNRRDFLINRKRVLRVMRQLGLQAIYPKPKTSVNGENHKIYPYLLRNVVISKPNQVWATDITYVRLPQGFVYLVAIIDVNSRYILSWRISNSMETSFCMAALEEALEMGRPEILNTDQGPQFTSHEWLDELIKMGILVSMNGKGRCLDNVYIERFWRSVKYEQINLFACETIKELRTSVEKYIKFYNEERVHQSLGYKTPAEVYFRKNVAEGPNFAITQKSLSPPLPTQQ